MDKKNMLKEILITIEEIFYIVSQTILRILEIFKDITIACSKTWSGTLLFLGSLIIIMEFTFKFTVPIAHQILLLLYEVYKNPQPP